MSYCTVVIILYGTVLLTLYCIVLLLLYDTVLLILCSIDLILQCCYGAIMMPGNIYASELHISPLLTIPPIYHTQHHLHP